ncbi:uncharacterized protein LOC103191012 [Callorhinchus milii]|uniref:uncharacterized protein LOC103191012 n=1 Tax=Callorhinchus milii TaxID=7868 RepID=UPI001C3F71C1|nr:uncharacterized protein LOC103191012 [Callorhinchus milii]
MAAETTLRTLKPHHEDARKPEAGTAAQSVGRQDAQNTEATSLRGSGTRGRNRSSVSGETRRMEGSSYTEAPVQSSRRQSNQASACLTAASVERDRNWRTEGATHDVNRPVDDDKIAIRQILKSYSDSELHMVTVFYRQRLEVMDDLVEDLTLMLEKLLRGRQFAHVRDLVNRNQRQEASRYLLDLVTAARSRVQRGMWEALVNIEDNKPQLKAILREIQEKGRKL